MQLNSVWYTVIGVSFSFCCCLFVCCNNRGIMNGRLSTDEISMWLFSAWVFFNMVEKQKLNFTHSFSVFFFPYFLFASLFSMEFCLHVCALRCCTETSDKKILSFPHILLLSSSTLFLISDNDHWNDFFFHWDKFWIAF